MDQQPIKTMHHDWQENADGTVTVTSRQDIEPYLRAAAEARSIDNQVGRQMTKDNGMHFVGSIPPVIVQLWRDEGFDVLSPEKSGMTEEQHQAEILRRLCGEYSLLNMSRFGRLA